MVKSTYIRILVVVFFLSVAVVVWVLHRSAQPNLLHKSEQPNTSSSPVATPSSSPVPSLSPSPSSPPHAEVTPSAQVSATVIAAPIPPDEPQSRSDGQPEAGYIGKLHLVIPVLGVKPEQLQDTFDDARSEGRVHDAIDIPAPQ